MRWSDLESADFGAYVSNLRGIGCPEATIRNILAPKVAAFYEEKRRQAQVAGPKTVGEVRREAQDLQREEARALDNLLGAALPQTNDTAPDAGTAATADGTSFVANQVQPAMFSRFGLPGIQQAPRSAPPAAATPQNGTAPAMTPTPNRSPSPSTAAANSSTSPSGTQAPNPMNSPDAVIPPEDPGGLSDAEYKLLYGEQAFLAYDLSRQAAKAPQHAKAQLETKAARTGNDGQGNRTKFLNFPKFLNYFGNHVACFTSPARNARTSGKKWLSDS